MSEYLPRGSYHLPATAQMKQIAWNTFAKEVASMAKALATVNEATDTAALGQRMVEHASGKPLTYREKIIIAAQMYHLMKPDMNTVAGVMTDSRPTTEASKMTTANLKNLANEIQL